MALPIILPLALLLTAIGQGTSDCLDIQDMSPPNITKAVSAEWPQGFPSWFPTTNSKKVDLTYDPCVMILSTDKIKVENSNVFDGTYSPVSTTGTCSVRIDIGKKYTANTMSTNATLKIDTDCADRMAYSLGEDINTLANAGGNIAGDLFGGLFGSIPWGAIVMILFAIISVYLGFQVIQIFKKP